MNRYSREHEINGTKLALVYASYAIPKSLSGYDSFKEILSNAQFPKNQVDKNNQFGFRLGVTLSKITPRTPTSSCMAYSEFFAKNQIVEENAKYSLIKCKYSSGQINDPLMTVVYGMNTDIPSLDNLLDSFTQKTGLKETDISKCFLKKLNRYNFPWNILLDELIQHSKI